MANSRLIRLIRLTINTSLAIPPYPYLYTQEILPSNSKSHRAFLIWIVTPALCFLSFFCLQLMFMDKVLVLGSIQEHAPEPNSSSNILCRPISALTLPLHPVCLECTFTTALSWDVMHLFFLMETPQRKPHPPISSWGDSTWLMTLRHSLKLHALVLFLALTSLL